MSASELKTLTETGAAPESRLTDAEAAYNIIAQLIEADDLRNQTRSKLQGLLDGNPPYRNSSLRKAGQADRTNVNFRTAEAFLEHGLSGFYDIFAETMTYAEVIFDLPDPTRNKQVQEAVTGAFQRANEMDDDLDDLIQHSQAQMVYYGNGPVAWIDGEDWRPDAFDCGQLLLPPNAPTKVSDWDHFGLRMTYSPARLYSFIRDPQKAKETGWNVEAVQRAIREAAPAGMKANISGKNWQQVQDQIRNNEVYWDSCGQSVRVIELFWREFPTDEDPHGSISCGIVAEGGTKREWLYRKTRAYAQWKHCICPFYFDRRNSQHHGTKGLGIKMFGALDLENRETCALSDASFARMSLILKPTTAEGVQKMAQIKMGPFMVLPPGVDMVQSNIAGALDAPLAVKNELTRMLNSNLSQYRPGLMKKEGNPRTAREVTIEAGEQSVLHKTQLNRYYVQMDDLWEERYRRLVSLAEKTTSEEMAEAVRGGEHAWAFREYLRNRGVTVAEAKKYLKVRASRVVGAGSAVQRQMVLTEMLGISSMLPEEGRGNLIDHYIAAKAGQDMVNLYNPKLNDIPNIHVWQAMIENGIMGENAPVTRVAGQNDMIHATVHLNAMAQAANSVQQGGNPMKVIDFLEQGGPHTAVHLAQFAKDPSRQEIYKAYEQQLQQIGRLNDQLKAQVQAKMEQQQKEAMANQQAQQAAMSKEAIEAQKAAAEIKREDIKTAAEIKRKQAKAIVDIQAKAAKTRTDVRTKDAKTATDIRLASAKAKADAAKPVSSK